MDLPYSQPTCGSTIQYSKYCVLNYISLWALYTVTYQPKHSELNKSKQAFCTEILDVTILNTYKVILFND